MDEIMNSACILAQDQYGNYVIQVSSGFVISTTIIIIHIHC